VIVADKKEPAAAESRLETLLAKFLETGMQNQLTPDMLREIVSTVGVQSAQVMHKAVRPENEIHPHISAFSYPEGDIARPKPKLARKTFVNFSEQREEQLTPYEIDSLNSFADDCEARNGNFKAIIKQRGRKTEELHITVPVAGINDRMNVPMSLLLLVHELQTGKSMEDMNTLLAELATLKAEVAGYRSARVPAAVTVTPRQSDNGLSMSKPTQSGVAGLEAALESAAVTV
jgi:hypothetical protein